MDKETTTSVTIDRKTFARLDRLAKSNNVSKKEFLSCALEYFEKYGINPVEHESPAKEMQKLIKRCDQVIAFIRKQEQDFLRPACEAMGSTSMRVTMSMDSILTEKKFSQYQKDNDLGVTCTFHSNISPCVNLKNDGFSDFTGTLLSFIKK